MKTINFSEANTILKGPEGSDILDIPVHAGEQENGCPYVIEMWQPSEEDKIAIAQGQPIALCLLTRSVPPISMWTTMPDGTMNFEKEDLERIKKMV
jgi:hypothetical protein